MRYILGYFALVFGLGGLELLGTGRPLGLVLVLVAAALVYLIVRMERARRRARRYGSYADAIEGYEKRFAGAERSLDAKLPQDALDSPALLELLSAYEHDTDDADRIRAEYGALRQRFVDWRNEFESMHAQSDAAAIGLPGQFAERYAELDQQLLKLLADVGRLEARAAEVAKATDDPLDQIARAALKLEQAQTACSSAFAGNVPEELESQLAIAGEKLGEARGAIAKKGDERPLEATRFAQAVWELAAAAEARVKELVTLPAEIDATRAEINADCARLELEIADAKSNLETAAETYAPSCLLEIRGCGAEAEQAVQRARSLAAEDGSGTSLQLTQAKQALARAAELDKRIEDHLAALEHAALAGRHNVEQAELDIDRAWAGVTASSTSADEVERAERVAARSRDLAAQARKEIEQQRPDWFRATSLAERAADMAQELASIRKPRTTIVGDSGAGVEPARARAEAALATVRPLVTEADGLLSEDNMARVCLERGEEAYRKALQLQKRLATADDPDAAARTAVGGFHVAEEAAAAAHEHALGLRSNDGTRPSGKTAAKVLWGAIDATLAPE